MIDLDPSALGAMTTNNDHEDGNGVIGLETGGLLSHQTSFETTMTSGNGGGGVNENADDDAIIKQLEQVFRVGNKLESVNHPHQQHNQQHQTANIKLEPIMNTTHQQQSQISKQQQQHSTQQSGQQQQQQQATATSQAPVKFQNQISHDDDITKQKRIEAISKHLKTDLIESFKSSMCGLSLMTDNNNSSSTTSNNNNNNSNSNNNHNSSSNNSSSSSFISGPNMSSLNQQQHHHHQHQQFNQPPLPPPHLQQQQQQHGVHSQTFYSSPPSNSSLYLSMADDCNYVPNLTIEPSSSSNMPSSLNNMLMSANGNFFRVYIEIYK